MGISKGHPARAWRLEYERVADVLQSSCQRQLRREYTELMLPSIHENVLGLLRDKAPERADWLGPPGIRRSTEDARRQGQSGPCQGCPTRGMLFHVILCSPSPPSPPALPSILFLFPPFLLVSEPFRTARFRGCGDDHAAHASVCAASLWHVRLPPSPYHAHLP